MFFSLVVRLDARGVGCTGSIDLDGGQVGLVGMDALLVTLEAIDAFELLVAVGTSPDSLVRVGEEMTA